MRRFMDLSQPTTWSHQSKTPEVRLLTIPMAATLLLNKLLISLDLSSTLKKELETLEKLASTLRCTVWLPPTTWFSPFLTPDVRSLTTPMVTLDGLKDSPRRSQRI